MANATMSNAPLQIKEGKQIMKTKKKVKTDKTTEELLTSVNDSLENLNSILWKLLGEISLSNDLRRISVDLASHPHFKEEDENRFFSSIHKLTNNVVKAWRSQ